MPRKRRMKTDTKMYHIIIRGVNKQDIFYDEQDIHKFLKELIRVKEKYAVKIYSYCLMPNHIHFEIEDVTDSLHKIMQSLEVSYSAYFNKKYERVGHLFQNRFLSKCIENEQYLIRLCRYIHQNPVKARISTLDKYKWSSYRSYIFNEEDKITDRQYILNLFDNDIEKFKNFSLENLYKNDEVEDLEFEIIKSFSDKEAIEIIRIKIGEANLQNIQHYNKIMREAVLSKLKNLKRSFMCSNIKSTRNKSKDYRKIF